MASQRVKKSMIASALVGTGGFFIAKAIGLIYSIPFSSILGSDTLMSYYGSSYNLYAYFLNVATAGIPFAIASLVAKYTVLEDPKTVLKIQKLSLGLMAAIGLASSLIMALLSGWLSSIMANGAEGIHTMQICLLILSLALFFVPLLSAYRGFVQGRKDMEEYAFSQAYEQLFRVGFLLLGACLVVYVFHLERTYALYIAVLSASVAAIAALFQIYRFVRKDDRKLKEQAERQIRKRNTKRLLTSIIVLAIPYLLAAIVGYSDSIYNAVLLPWGLKLSHYSEAQQAIMISAVNYVGVKLTAIPMVLAPGFTAAIIPHISENMARHDYRKIRTNVLESLNIVIFIVAFLSFAIFLYARPLFYCLFYTTDIDLSAYCMRWIALEGFLNSIAPIITTLMMTLNLQGSVLKRMLIMAIMKGVLMVPLVMWFGVAGSVISTVISYGYLIVANLAQIGKDYHIRYKSTFRLFFQIALGLLAMSLVYWILSLIGFGSIDSGKLLCFAGMIISGILASAAFLAVELYLHVPQRLFKFKFNLKSLKG